MTDELRMALEAGLGHRFARPERLSVAVTHRSFHPDVPNNETLEFLGDAVLALAMSDLLMARFPEAREGDLSKRRAALVNAASLARKARSLDLGRWILLGKGEERSGGREKAKILASAYEALLGAVHLDAGYEAARRVLRPHLEAAFMKLKNSQVVVNNYKSALQEHFQKREAPPPCYRILDSAGPDHRKEFKVEVTHEGRVLARASGPSKKAAEQNAAQKALKKILGRKIRSLSQDMFFLKTK